MAMVVAGEQEKVGTNCMCVPHLGGLAISSNAIPPKSGTRAPLVPIPSCLPTTIATRLHTVHYSIRTWSIAPYDDLYRQLRFYLIFLSPYLLPEVDRVWSVPELSLSRFQAQAVQKKGT